jgi:predicted PurR-regulated permease PerM
MPTVFPVRFTWYVLAVAAAGLLLYLMAPILTPFLLSAVLAYICLPSVDRISRKAPRWLAAAIVMVLLLIGVAELALIVLPMVERQFVAFLQRMPEYLDWARSPLVTWLSGTLGVELNLDIRRLRHLRAHYVDSDLYNS